MCGAGVQVIVVKQEELLTGRKWGSLLSSDLGSKKKTLGWGTERLLSERGDPP